MNYGSIELAALCGLRKQFTEAKQRSLELKRKKYKENVNGGRREEMAQVCSRGRGKRRTERDRKRDPGVLHLRNFRQEF